MSHRRALAALLLVVLTACSSPASKSPDEVKPDPASPSVAAVGEVVVYAPGALAAQTKALAAGFEASGQGTISFEVGHTPVQREQLAKGATPDVWIAANPTDVQTAADGGFVDGDGVVQIARTKLTVVVAPGNPAEVTALADLAKPGVRVLLPVDTLPIWKATAKTLEKVEKSDAGFTDKLMANTVSREMGVQPIVSKVQLGEADAGIVFVTDVTADARGKGVETVEIPDEVNTVQPLLIALVTASKNPEGAKTFIDWMVSGDGANIMAEAGFLPPESP